MALEARGKDFTFYFTVVTDVNFPKFYFWLQEFQISRIAEYSKLNAALRDSP